MRSAPLRAFRRALVALGLIVLGTSCGGADGEDDGPPQDVDPPVGVCTGAAPENATLCPGTDTGLTADAPRVVRAYCLTTPCSYTCNTGYVIANGACQPVSPPAAVQFVDNGDGTVSVTDSFGTVVWLRNAHCLETIGGIERSTDAVLWTEAMTWSAGLASGACGLTDGSAPGDWSLPLVSDLQYLSLDLATAGAAAWDLFTDIQETAYWSDFSVCVGFQGAVVIRTGQYDDVREGSRYGVWPIKR